MARHRSLRRRALTRRWLGQELDPHDLLVPFPADFMTIGPVSRRLNSPENDDASLLENVLESNRAFFVKNDLLAAEVLTLT